MDLPCEFEVDLKWRPLRPSTQTFKDTHFPNLWSSSHGRLPGGRPVWYSESCETYPLTAAVLPRALGRAINWTEMTCIPHWASWTLFQLGSLSSFWNRIRLSVPSSPLRFRNRWQVFRQLSVHPCWTGNSIDWDFSTWYSLVCPPRTSSSTVGSNVPWRFAPSWQFGSEIVRTPLASFKD